MTSGWSPTPGSCSSRRSPSGLGIEALAQGFVRLRPDRPGVRNAGRKVMALIYALALGADCIDDCDVLRAGCTRVLRGGWIAAPSTLGAFLRAFTFGHMRQTACRGSR